VNQCALCSQSTRAPLGRSFEIHRRSPKILIEASIRPSRCDERTCRPIVLAVSRNLDRFAVVRTAFTLALVSRLRRIRMSIRLERCLVRLARQRSFFSLACACTFEQFEKRARNTNDRTRPGRLLDRGVRPFVGRSQFGGRSPPVEREHGLRC
jgi:hypothetical protein